MLKPKYGNEIAFTMGSIVASYGGKLEKKAQLLTPDSEKGTGGPIGMSNTISDTIDEEIGDPTDIGGLENTAPLLEGEHVSLLEQEDELDALSREFNKELEGLGPSSLEDPGGTVDLGDGSLPVRENPFEKSETVEIDFDANDPANLFRDPTGVGAAPSI